MGWNSLTARLDYWNVDLDNGIALLPLQGLIGLEFEGQCVNTGRIEEYEVYGDAGGNCPLRFRQPPQAGPGHGSIG